MPSIYLQKTYQERFLVAKKSKHEEDEWWSTDELLPVATSVVEGKRRSDLRISLILFTGIERQLRPKKEMVFDCKVIRVRFSGARDYLLLLLLQMPKLQRYASWQYREN